MLDRFFHILIIDENQLEAHKLENELVHQFHIINKASSAYDALSILKNKKVDLIVFYEDMNRMDPIDFLKTLRSSSYLKNTYKLVIQKEVNDEREVELLNAGATDTITYPIHSEIIKSKINVYKKLHFNQQRVLQLLRNVLPEETLEEFSKYGKSSPKRYENGIILFTDFVNFSTHAKETEPIQLIKRLDTYFKKFDVIIEKYQLEKIKTIGDAYMVVGGLNNDATSDALKMALAAIEMRDYMITEEQTSLAFGETPWLMRMGIHAGSIVTGVIGSKKFAFDVWGDSVNVAARTEETCTPRSIYITEEFALEINTYFETDEIGQLEIRKRGGIYNIHELKQLKPTYQLENIGVANSQLRKIIGLPEVDFEHARIDILNKLKVGLDENYVYHSLDHTLDVESAVERLAELEGLSQQEITLLKTAALFHDAGFLVAYENNEDIGCKIASLVLPQYGYSEEHINFITATIRATSSKVEPKNLFEQIICDADHDYIGRPDYERVAQNLRNELAYQGQTFEDREWYEFQLRYLEEVQHYYSNTAKSTRNPGKELRKELLRERLKTL